jgi:signal transduction histidine kinase
MKDPRKVTDAPERVHLRRKRRRLAGLALAVLLPLAVMQVLQYRWLLDLEKQSSIGRRSRMGHYLDGVAKEVEYFYREDANRSLAMKPGLLKPDWFHKAAYYFKKNEATGAQRRFLVNYLAEPGQQLFFLDPETVTFEPAREGEVPDAVSVALAPFSLRALEVGGAHGAGLLVEEWSGRDRLILNPITDEAERLVGVTGYEVDQELFEAKILPQILDKALPNLEAEKELRLTVRDGLGRLVLARGGGPEAPPEAEGREIQRPLTFLFEDWTLTLEGGDARLQRLAEANFATNLTLSAVLFALILGGVVLLLRSMAREMKLIEMKNDFVSNVSHELRTPLASIRVFGELLRLGRVESPDKIREYGEYIETESRRLTQLINNILDFSRIEAGHRRYHFEPTDLREVLADALKTFQVRLQKEGFEVAVDEPQEALPPVAADAGALGQAVCNLLDNAIKYSNGGRCIGVRLRREKGEAVLSVRDEGIGISREEQARIFERFHRVGTGLVHDVKGSGLGLSIVQHVVVAHGGHVRVESEVGEGSTFSFVLPFHKKTGPAIRGRFE